jgi:hypothetical protein
VAWVDMAFAKLDDNGDGFISLEEIMARLPLMSTDPEEDVQATRLLEVSVTYFL